jgi:hypothetical protein
MVILGNLGSGNLEFDAEMLILYAPADYSINFNPKNRQTGSGAPSGRKRRIALAAFDPSLGSDAEAKTQKFFDMRHCGFVHIGNVYQRAQILNAITEVDSADITKPLVTGDRVKLRFRFANQREYLRRGMRILYREDSSRGSYGAKMAGEVVQ